MVVRYHYLKSDQSFFFFFFSVQRVLRATHINDIKVVLRSLCPSWCGSEFRSKLLVASTIHVDIAEELVVAVLRHRGFREGFGLLCSMFETGMDQTNYTYVLCNRFFTECTNTFTPCGVTEPSEILALVEILLKFVSFVYYETIVEWLYKWNPSCDHTVVNVLLALSGQWSHTLSFGVLLLCFVRVFRDKTAKETVATHVVEIKSLTTGTLGVELLAELVEYLDLTRGDSANSPRLSKLLSTSVGKETLASKGDWSVFVGNSHNLPFAGRVVKRLVARGTTIPDDILEALVEKHLHLVWTSPFQSCAKHLNFIKSLGTEKLVVRKTLKSWYKLLEGLPTELVSHLPYSQYIQFCRCWLNLIVVLPRRFHRQSLVTIVSILQDWSDVNSGGTNSKSSNPSKAKRSTASANRLRATSNHIVSVDVCRVLSDSLRSGDVRSISCWVVENRDGNCTQLLAFLLQVLYYSRMKRRVYLQMLREMRGNNLIGLITKYRARLVVESPSLFKEDHLWTDLRQPNSYQAWAYLFQEAPEPIVEEMSLRLVRDVQRTATVSFHIKEIVSKCRKSTLLRFLDILYSHLIDGSYRSSVIHILQCMLTILENLDESDFTRAPTICRKGFAKLGDKGVVLQSKILARVIVISIQFEHKCLRQIKSKVPPEVLDHIGSFLMYTVSVE